MFLLFITVVVPFKVSFFDPELDTAKGDVPTVTGTTRVHYCPTSDICYVLSEADR